jgi:predicted enzyme related to lactoylglutathione lyase
MQIKLTSLMVEDQARALKFYTEVLGFKAKRDFPVGEYRWLSVVSPEGPDDVELSLEPNVNPAAKAFQKAMFEQGIPLAAFQVRNLEGEYKRLKEAGVAFTQEPVRHDAVALAVFSDTVGNLIQIYQPLA